MFNQIIFKMKKGILFLSISLLFFAISCNQNSKKENTETETDSTKTEKENKVEIKDEAIQIVELSSKKMLSIHSNVPMQEIGQEMGKSFSELMQYAGENNIQMTGAPVAIYYSWEGTNCEFESGIIVETENTGNERIKLSDTYAGKALVIEHYGSYESTNDTWQKLENHINNNKMEMNGAPWEEYITDPMSEPDTSKWLTKLYWPIK